MMDTLFDVRTVTKGLLTVAAVAALLAAGPSMAGTAKHGGSLSLAPAHDSYTTRTNDPGHGQADDHGPEMSIAFARLDTNSNGVISRSEAKASKTVASHFAQIDRNHDLQITPSEFAAFQTMQARQEEAKASGG